MFKYACPNGLLISKTEPAINQQGENTSHVYSIVSATELHISVGQDSLLHRKLNFKGRPDHRNQSINMKTSTRQKSSSRTVPQRIRIRLRKTSRGEEDLPSPKFPCAYGKEEDGEGWGGWSNTITSNGHHHAPSPVPWGTWVMMSQA